MALAVFTGMVAVFTAEQRPFSRQFAWPFSPEYPKGKIGRDKSFFEEAFGGNVEEFHKILWMPETFIIHRFKYKNNHTAEWWRKFNSLGEIQLTKLKEIVAANLFHGEIATGDRDVDEVLKFYQMSLV